MISSLGKNSSSNSSCIRPPQKKEEKEKICTEPYGFTVELLSASDSKSFFFFLFIQITFSKNPNIRRGLPLPLSSKVFPS